MKLNRGCQERKREGWLRRLRITSGVRWCIENLHRIQSITNHVAIDRFLSPCLVPHHRHPFQSSKPHAPGRNLVTSGHSRLQCRTGRCRTLANSPSASKKNRTEHEALLSVCANTGCPFKVNATYSVVKECVTVVVEEEHNCMRIGLVERSSNWLRGRQKKKREKKRKETGSPR